MINLVDKFRRFLLSEQNVPTAEQEQVNAEVEVQETGTEYILDDGETKITVLEDGTIVGIDAEPNKEYFTADKKVIITGEDGKVIEIKDIVVPEDEQPVEAPVELEDEEMKAKDELIEKLLEQVSVLQTENEDLKKKLDEAIIEVEGLRDCKKKDDEEIMNLKSQIPTVVAGIEIVNGSDKTQSVEHKPSISELLKTNFGR